MTKYLIIGIVVLGLIAGIIYGAKSYVDGVDAKAYKRGQQEAENAYVKRDNRALVDAQAEIERLRKAAADKETEHQLAITQAEAVHEQDLQDADTRSARIQRQLRKQLDEARAAAPSGGANGACTEAPADTGGSELAGWRARLSDDDVRFFVGEARSANVVLARLNECRKTLEIERR